MLIKYIFCISFAEAFLITIIQDALHDIYTGIINALLSVDSKIYLILFSLNTYFPSNKKWVQAADHKYHWDILVGGDCKEIDDGLVFFNCIVYEKGFWTIFPGRYIKIT